MPGHRQRARRAGGDWDVITDRGPSTAEHVVNAAGLREREVARMAGAEPPLQPMEHPYVVTDALAGPDLDTADLPHVIDAQGQHSVRP